MITPFTFYTNGSNNYFIYDVIPPDYPFPDVIKYREYHHSGTVYIENIRTFNKGFLSIEKFLAKIEAGELKPVTE